MNIFITGATSGIGKACAERFAAAKHNLVVTGRRKERLEESKRQLEKEFSVKVHVCCFDVQVKEDVFAAIDSLPQEWKSIDVLINNAGLALGKKGFAEADMSDWETMLRTNIDGLLHVSRAVLPCMVKYKKGHVINIGSLAGKQVYENGNVYCGSKAAVDAITKSMRIDLLKHSIKVTGIHPGAVETEFALVRYKGDAATAKAVFAARQSLAAADVAEAAFYCANLPAHVCINELVMTCTEQADSFYFLSRQ